MPPVTSPTNGTQIAVGGKNRYLLNGKVVQPGRIHNFFQSVQLNINNPHFMVRCVRGDALLEVRMFACMRVMEGADS